MQRNILILNPQGEKKIYEYFQKLARSNLKQYLEIFKNIVENNFEESHSKTYLITTSTLGEALIQNYYANVKTCLSEEEKKTQISNFTKKNNTLPTNLVKSFMVTLSGIYESEFNKGTQEAPPLFSLTGKTLRIHKTAWINLCVHIAKTSIAHETKTDTKPKPKKQKVEKIPVLTSQVVDSNKAHLSPVNLTATSDAYLANAYINFIHHNNDLLEERKKLLDKIPSFNPDFLKSDEYQNQESAYQSDLEESKTFIFSDPKDITLEMVKELGGFNYKLLQSLSALYDIFERQQKVKPSQKDKPTSPKVDTTLSWFFSGEQNQIRSSQPSNSSTLKYSQ